MIRAALLLLALPLAACATTAGSGGSGGGPTDVIRFHLGKPIAAGTVRIVPGPGDGNDPGFGAYADAVARQLTALGYQPTTDADAAFTVAVSYRRNSAGYVRRRPTFSVGLGGGSFGRGVGVGGGVSTGIGGGRREVIASELAVQLRRRSDDVVVWDGRASRQALAGRERGDVADILATALFKGFPGESGITISVP